MDVSIVIPTYNRKNSLVETVKSLFNQDFPKEKYEILICDDGSTDETYEIVKNLQNNAVCELRYYRQENAGPAAARNLGIKESRGSIVGFIDDDCTATNKWILNAVKEFKNRNVGGVQGPTVPLGIMQFKKKIFNYARTSDVTEQNYSYATCNIFYRKNLLYDTGLFDENFPRPCWGEDTDLGNKIVLNGYDIAFNDEVKAFHEIQYIPFIKYLKSLKKYEGRAYLVKKYPFMRKKYPLKFIGVKSHLYPIFVLSTLILSLIHISNKIDANYIYASFVMSMILYLWGRVLLDKKYKKYFQRILFFPRYFLIDLVGLYYTIKGCIRFKTILI
jgi:glycosyltransferase involved in cell wall biosynthesis